MLVTKMDKEKFDNFLLLSSKLTGFPKLDLLGTGLALDYYDLVKSIIGDIILDQMYNAGIEIFSRDHEVTLEKEYIRDKILSDSKFGPVSRSMIKLWYLGQWDPLPAVWRAEFGSHTEDTGRIISSESYQEGLVWVAIAAHPMGAKQPGFGSWTQPPQKDLR